MITSERWTCQARKQGNLGKVVLRTILWIQRITASIHTVPLKKWCGREDSNFHGSYPTATSTLRVYQFRHDRMINNVAT